MGFYLGTLRLEFWVCGQMGGGGGGGVFSKIGTLMGGSL